MMLRCKLCGSICVVADLSLCVVWFNLVQLWLLGEFLVSSCPFTVVIWIINYYREPFFMEEQTQVIEHLWRFFPFFYQDSLGRIVYISVSVLSLVLLYIILISSSVMTFLVIVFIFPVSLSYFYVSIAWVNCP